MITGNYNPKKITPASYTETEEGIIDPILKKKGLKNTVYESPTADTTDQPKVQKVDNETPEIDSSPKADLSAGTIATGAIQGIGAVYAREQQEPLSRKAGAASTLGLAAQGASIGTSILPGWGTVIGAAAGAIYGGVKQISDKKKRDKQANRDRVEAFNKVKTEREEAQRLADSGTTPLSLNPNSGIYSNYNKK